MKLPQEGKQELQMFNFSMSTRENFATFTDQETGKVVFVDSFDNREFEVRYGTLEESVPLGSVRADNDEMLNRQLAELIRQKNNKYGNNSG